MENHPQDDILSRLTPEVRGYALPHFALGDDLRRLVEVQKAGAWEAVVLYAARILEVLTAEALTAVELPADPNSFHNLDLLEQYNLMPPATLYWAHALRRLGNDVRHIDRRITGDDAGLAIGFVERVVHWFFCAFAHGHQLSSLTTDGERLDLGCAPDLQTLVAAFDRSDLDPARLAEQCVAGQWPGFLKTSAVPAVLAEKLLAREQNPLAQQVLTAASRVFADDLRLRQLMGLYWSRIGDFDEALRCLEPLQERWHDDEETVGLLAGVYKRRWLTRREEEEWLSKAFRLYSRGWDAGKKASPYLGINAATTALWLGRRAESRRIAAEVCQRLLDRAGRLAHFRTDRDLALNYWDHATLAEAQLLLGQWGRSRRTYNAAFRLHADQTKNIAVSRAQAVEGLIAQGMSAPAAESFFDVRPDSSAGVPLIVGVVSESDFPIHEALRDRIRGILASIDFQESNATRLAAAGTAAYREAGPTCRRPLNICCVAFLNTNVVVLTALTEAASRAVARDILSRPGAGTLRVVLHDELESCLVTLPSAEARADFQWCIDRAESVIFPSVPEKPAHGSRRTEKAAPSGRQWAARYLAEHCHVLLCLGDQPISVDTGVAQVDIGVAVDTGVARSERSEGRDVPPSHALRCSGRATQPLSAAEISAAEVVAQADRLGRPVIQIFSQPPYNVAYNRVALSPRSEATGGFQVYIPHPIDTSESLLPESLTELTERLAESTHDNWAQRRLADGWNWGPARDDEAKKHPGLVPYAQLPDAEKDYDRATAMETLKAIMALGYRIDRAE